ncbi:hypothetical protein [Dyella sp.]|uniref:hypothetical protein n=1 Tax=Dyella sp. TaxID=1869338 RepID=UPI002ED14755
MVLDLSSVFRDGKRELNQAKSSISTQDFALDHNMPKVPPDLTPTADIAATIATGKRCRRGAVFFLEFSINA